MVNALSFLG